MDHKYLFLTAGCMSVLPNKTKVRLSKYKDEDNEQLIKILLGMLTKIDNFQQIAADLNKPTVANVMSYAYDHIEWYYFTLKKGWKICQKSKNDIRFINKFVDKIINKELICLMN